jgi:ATP-dependent Lon protease
MPKAIKNHGSRPKSEWSDEDDALVVIRATPARPVCVTSSASCFRWLARKAVKEILTKKIRTITVTPQNVERLPRRAALPLRRGRGLEDQVGVVTGLAWTEVGGELLTIEGVMMPGKGKMTVTGNLRDVMKESISAANAYVRSRSIDFGIEPPLSTSGHSRPRTRRRNAQGRPVRRCRHGHGHRLDPDRHSGAPDVAMTGEITLRGRVLPIGGLKEKLLAALRGGDQDRSDPRGERQRPGGHPGQVKNGLEIIPVSQMDEVLDTHRPRRAVPKGDAVTLRRRHSSRIHPPPTRQSNVFPVKSLYKARVSGEFGCTGPRDA